MLQKQFTLALVLIISINTFLDIAPGLASQPVWSQDPKGGVEQIVRLMGYGGGIHNFKNFLLRGNPAHSDQATEDFLAVLRVVEQLQDSNEFDDEDQKGLEAISQTVSAYMDTLQVVTRMRLAKVDIAVIDETVIIDDGPALRAIQRLRSKWNWTDFQELEFVMGYGHAIHSFKNYVIRCGDNYLPIALKELLAAEFLINNLLNEPQVRDPRSAAEDVVKADDTLAGSADIDRVARNFRQRRAALETIKRTIVYYRNNLPLAEKLHSLHLSTRQVDAAIRINDNAGEESFEFLRGTPVFTLSARR